ncbi:MAG: diacylglycerol kinase family lipid kinase, partial [Deltaproteobacteria bacterium]
PGDATHLTRQALHQGSSVIVAVGGDGTINEVVNGFFEGASRISPSARLGILPTGTGSDFIKTAGIPSDLEAAIEILHASEGFDCDLGRVTYTTMGGEEACRYFINIADFGIGGAVIERINRKSKALGGFLSYLWNSIVTLTHFAPPRIRFRIDDHAWKELPLMIGVVANGRFFSGGLQVAPMATLNDGRFDLILIEPFGMLEFFKYLPRFYLGIGKRNPYEKMFKAHHFPIERLEARSRATVLIDIDGEQPGRLPARFEIVPAAIRLLAPLPG